MKLRVSKNNLAQNYKKKRLRELNYSWSAIEKLKIGRVGKISLLPYVPHRHDGQYVKVTKK